MVGAQSSLCHTNLQKTASKDASSTEIINNTTGETLSHSSDVSMLNSAEADTVSQTQKCSTEDNVHTERKCSKDNEDMHRKPDSKQIPSSEMPINPFLEERLNKKPPDV